MNDLDLGNEGLKTIEEDGAAVVRKTAIGQIFKDVLTRFKNTQPPKRLSIGL